VAVEPFEYVPDGPGCAEVSARHVRTLWASLQ
jgi:D-psicose/D-tagatose/L-ribulose 3-epimerase